MFKNVQKCLASVEIVQNNFGSCFTNFSTPIYDLPPSIFKPDSHDNLMIFQLWIYFLIWFSLRKMIQIYILDIVVVAKYFLPSAKKNQNGNSNTINFENGLNSISINFVKVQNSYELIQMSFSIYLSKSYVKVWTF